MIIPFEKDRMDTPVCARFIERLKQVYAAMDRAYHRTADAYGFTCDGCVDNCCRTRFYHHTMIEYFYLKEGLNTLSRKMQNELKLRALAVVAETTKADDRGAVVRLMCPLNVDELCILYAYRPMICRLHGLPHEIKKPGQKSIYGSGCETFDRRCGSMGYFEFDRTPFYLELAKLEQAVKQALGVTEKFKMTVAEMILSIAERRA